ncbi:MAG: sulfite exporter TauE/SafE family protein, partial [Chloroflexota bacterium]|nr:sulfite exporter TauE/SafE family protein [Chloroflexota bacterium]
TERLSPQFIAFALLLALGLGAVHALSPGHGKTVVGAYLVGARGTARHALFLGLTVTMTHTISVFALGLVTLYASQYILPEQLYPWLGILSGAMVVVMGITLFTQRLRAVRAASGHTHTPAHGHAHDPHDHTHEGAHPHDHHGHPHAHDHTHHHHDHDHAWGHEHGPHTHTHVPPGADGSPSTWRSLLALGISGGLIPCPSALLVMLGAISLGRVGFGLLLIVAFSLGLAGVLTGIGLLFVYGGRWLSRMSRGRTSVPGLRLVPIASALVVTTAGLAITARAVIEAGLLR